MQILRDPDLLRQMPEKWLSDQAVAYPWFALPHYLLARREVIEQPGHEPSHLTTAAVYAFNRARLKSWISGQLDREIQILTAAFPEEADETQIPEAVLPVIEAALPVIEAVLPVSEALSEAALPVSEAIEVASRSFSQWLSLYRIPSPEEKVHDSPKTGSSQNPLAREATAHQHPAGSEPGLPARGAEHDAERGAERDAEPGKNRGTGNGSSWRAGLFEGTEDIGQLGNLIEQQRALRSRRIAPTGGSPSADERGATAIRNNPATDQGFAGGNSTPGWHFPQTETYAQILVEQGKWVEAEAIYAALRLRHPEKSGFFALRIQEIQQKRNL